MKICKIRPDLLKGNLGAPIQYGFIRGKESYKYRWTGKGGNVFQVWVKGNWNTAHSIDFEF